MLPGVELQGITTFAWADGGAFLVMRSQVDEPRFPDGVAYIGSDDDRLAQAMTVTAQSDGTLIGEGRMSQDRGPWGADLSQIFRPLHEIVDPVPRSGRPSSD
jgi:hypothetical protein